MKNITLSLICVFLFGCQNFQVGSKVPEWPWKQDLHAKNQSTLCSNQDTESANKKEDNGKEKEITVLSTQSGTTQNTTSSDKPYCSVKNAIDSFLLASNYCTALYDNYRSEMGSSKSIGGIVGILGTFSGILGGVTEGGVSSFMSGFSGATNAFQASASEMLTATATIGSLNTIQELSARYTDLIRDNVLSKKYDEAVFNSVRFAGQCKYSASVIENKMVNSILPSGDGVGVTKTNEQNQSQIVGSNKVNRNNVDISNSSDRIDSATSIDKNQTKADTQLTSLPAVSILNSSQLPSKPSIEE